MADPARLNCPECDAVHVVARRGEDVGSVRATCTRCTRSWAIPTSELPEEASLRCFKHDGRRAKWFCDRCSNGLCSECIPPRRIQSVETRLSPCCDAHGIPLAPTFRVDPPWRRPLDLLRFPLHRRGLPIFAIVVIGLQLPVINWLILLLLFGYLAHVLVTSAKGGTHLPEFPEFTNAWESVFFPMGRLLLTGWWAFAPLWFYAKWQGHNLSDPAIWLLWILGFLLTPMIVTLGALATSVLPAINPVNILRFIGAAGSVYLFTAGTLFVLWAAYLPLREYLITTTLGAWLLPVASLYVWFLSFHLLGRMAYVTQDRVDWGV